MKYKILVGVIYTIVTVLIAAGCCSNSGTNSVQGETRENVVRWQRLPIEYYIGSMVPDYTVFKNVVLTTPRNGKLVSEGADEDGIMTATLYPVGNPKEKLSLGAPDVQKLFDVYGDML
jgi:hypothetical protein